MIDLHVHTLLSDGVLLPTEVVRRYKVLGAKAVALTDHVDVSNIESVIPKLVKVCKELTNHFKMKVVPGCELTHLPLVSFSALVKLARKLGAKLVLGHGETIVEPVLPGTNRAAILAGIDILTHPGLLSEKDAKLAKERDIYLEVSSRAGHALTNGHVVNLARKFGNGLIFSTDAHEPKDFLPLDKAYQVLYGAGLNAKEAKMVFLNARKLIN